jgi:hypothetical protein
LDLIITDGDMNKTLDLSALRSFSGGCRYWRRDRGSRQIEFDPISRLNADQAA